MRLVDTVAQRIRGFWQLARSQFAGQIMQQSVLPVAQPLLGLNERRLPGSPASLVERLNLRTAEFADGAGVDMLDLGRAVIRDGLNAWHDPVLWHRGSKKYPRWRLPPTAIWLCA